MLLEELNRNSFSAKAEDWPELKLVPGQQIFLIERVC